MKSFLKWLVNFLERKFPDKVEVTKEKYDLLSTQLIATQTLVKKHEEDIEALKIRIGNMDVALGFAAPKIGVLER